MADEKTRAIRAFFVTRQRADAARDAYEHWTWNVDPGSDYRSSAQDRMANTLADLCLCTEEQYERAEQDIQRLTDG